MSVFKRGKYFNYDFWIAGERFQGPTRCTTRSAARTFEEGVKAQVRAGTYGRVPVVSADTDHTLGAAIRGYFKGRSGRSIRASKRYARVLVQIMGENSPFLNFDHYRILEVRDAVAALRVESRHAGCIRADIARGDAAGDVLANQKNKNLPLLSVATVNRYMEFLRRLILWGCENWLQPAPNINWSKKKRDRANRPPILKSERPRTRVLRDEEAKAFAQAVRKIRPELEAFFEFEAETGLRTETAVTLSWSMVDWSRRIINVVIGKVEAEYSAHTLPLSPRAIELLQSQQGNHKTRVFTLISRRKRDHQKRIMLTCSNFRKALKDVCIEAGIEDFRNHDFRHTAATRLIEAGGGVPDVQQLLGVRDVKTAMRYINHDPRIAKLQSKQPRLFAA